MRDWSIEDVVPSNVAYLIVLDCFTAHLTHSSFLLAAQQSSSLFPKKNLVPRFLPPGETMKGWTLLLSLYPQKHWRWGKYRLQDMKQSWNSHFVEGSSSLHVLSLCFLPPRVAVMSLQQNDRSDSALGSSWQKGGWGKKTQQSCVTKQLPQLTFAWHRMLIRWCQLWCMDACNFNFSTIWSVFRLSPLFAPWQGFGGAICHCCMWRLIPQSAILHLARKELLFFFFANYCLLCSYTHLVS